MKEKGKGSLSNRLRSILGLLIAAVMIFSMIPVNGLLPSAYAAAQFSGSGTEEDPYQIATLAELEDRPLLRSVEENGQHNNHSMSTDCSDAEGETLLTFEPLTNETLKSMSSEDNNYYVIAGGNYYLAEDITLEHEIQMKDKTVNLCLNGHTINRSGSRVNAISVSGNSELNICDCGGRGEISVSSSGNAIKVAQDTEADTELKTLNIYGGTIIGKDIRKSLLSYGAVYVGENSNANVNIYGGTLKGSYVSAVTICSGTLTVDGEAVKISTDHTTDRGGSVGGVNAENATVNINQGKIYSDGEYSYGIVLYGGVELNIKGGNIEGSYSGIRNQGDRNNIKISGGTVTGKKWQGIGTNDARSYNISISGNPTISGVYNSYSLKPDGNVKSDIYLGSYGKIVIEEPTNTKSYIVECSENRLWDITQGWSTYMQGKNPEDYFKLCEYPKNKKMVLNEKNGELKVRNIIISLDANGGKFKSGAAKTVEVTDVNAKLADQFDTLPTEMTRQYYEFSCWTTEKDNPDTEVTRDTVFTDDTIIYAYYTHEHQYGDWSLTQDEETGEVTAERSCLAGHTESLPVDVTLEESEISTVYSGSAQTPQPVVTMDGSDITGSFGIAWSDNTDAGTAAITLTGQGSFSGTITKTFEITPAVLTVTGAKAEDRDYDGTNMAAITDITLDGIKNGDDVKASAVLKGTLDSSNAGSYDKIKLPELTLTGAKAKNYTLVQPEEKVTLQTPVVISKAAAPEAVSGRLEIKNNFSRTYSFPLSSLRPEGADEAGWGNTQYEIVSADVDSRYSSADDIKLEGNILKIKVKSVQDVSEGKVGTVTVKIKTDNYEDFTGTVEIYAANIEAGVIEVGSTTITIPEGKSASEDEEGNIIIPEGSKVTSGGTSVTVLNGEGTVDHNGKLTAPSGSTAVTENGISIVLSAGGLLDGEGFLEAEKAVVGNTAVTALTGETVIIHKDGSAEVSKGGTIEIAGTIVTVTDGTAAVGKGGTVNFRDGGQITVEKDGKTETVTVPQGGKLSINENDGGLEVEIMPDTSVTVGDITVTDNGDGTITVKKAGEETGIIITIPENSANPTIDGDGNVTVPAGSIVKMESGVQITLPLGGSVNSDKTVEAEKAVVGETIITAPSGQTVTVDENGNTTVSPGFRLENGSTAVTVTEGTGTAGKDGTISFWKGGKVTVEKDGQTESISIPAGGNITLNADDGTGSNDSKTEQPQNGNVIKQEGTTADKSISAALGDAVDVLKSIVFSEDELSLIAEGKNASVWMTVEDITGTVSEADKSLALKAADGYKTGAFLDLNCFKQLDGGKAVHLTELEKEITVSLTIPDALKNTDSSIKRTYAVLRVHGSETKLLEGSYDEKTGVLTFKTGLFSTYVICYRDEAAGNTSGGDVSENADTGDKTPIASYAVVMILSGAVAAVAARKKKRLAK